MDDRPEPRDAALWRLEIRPRAGPRGPGWQVVLNGPDGTRRFDSLLAVMAWLAELDGRGRMPGRGIR